MVTVVVPCHNEEKRIRRCLQSILGQTNVDMEILVINDGSTDRTVQEIQKVQQLYGSQVRLINQSNEGVSAARNRGIEEAKGQWIAFVDSDDYVESTYLQTLRGLAEENVLPVVGFAKNNEQENALHNEIGGRYEVNAAMPNEYLAGKLGAIIGHSCWNKLFSKKVLSEHNIRFRTELKLGEDMLFVLQYLCHCRFVVWDGAVQYHYCDNENSATRMPEDQSKDYERTLCVLDGLHINGYSIGKAALNSWCLEAMGYILGNQQVSSMAFSEFCEYMKKVRSYSITAFAKQEVAGINFHRKIFHWALKREFAGWIFLFVKVQGFRKRWCKQ